MADILKDLKDAAVAELRALLSQVVEHAEESWLIAEELGVDLARAIKEDDEQGIAIIKATAKTHLARLHVAAENAVNDKIDFAIGIIARIGKVAIGGLA